MGGREEWGMGKGGRGRGVGVRGVRGGVRVNKGSDSYEPS